jgi:hypothetical protein
MSSIVQPFSRFLNLPRELRDEIYRFLVPSCTTLDFAAPTWADNAAERFVNVQYDMSAYSLKILAISQQTRAEASALLYGTNRFEFSIGTRPATGYWVGNGPSPYNTVRALPRSAISQIITCRVRISMCRWCKELPPSPEMRTVKLWLEEMCELLKQGGHLQVMEIELDDRGYRPIRNTLAALNVRKYQRLLEPLEELRGLKSAVVEGEVESAYGVELVKLMESGAVGGKKRKVVKQEDT